MSFLVDPHDDEKLPNRTLAYVSEMTRDAIYDLVIRSFVESGLSQASLAKRLGKDPAQVNRTLGAPGNWTIDTCAELLYAIDGSVLKPEKEWLGHKAPSNRRWSNCLTDYHLDEGPRVANSQPSVFVEKPLFAAGNRIRALAHAE